MEKTVTTTNDNVKNAAYGVDESGRTYVGNMLRNTVNPWQTIEEIQRRFSLPAPECNGALQFLSALEASNCSINLFLLDGLTAQLDALIDKLDQRSRLDLLKQSIKLIEVKELQFISVSIMKRLDIIPDKYLRGLISRELISEFPTMVRRQAWKLDRAYFLQSVKEMLLKSGQSNCESLVDQLIGMIEASKELFEGFAEYCNLQSLYRKRRGQQPSASASASSSALSTGTVTADPADTDSKVVEFVALKASYEKGADNYANLLRRVIVTLQEKGQKIQSAEKLHDYAMVLDRCRRQNAIDAVAITSIVHHVGDMIRGREAAEEKNFRRSEDAYLASCPDVVPEKDEYLPKAPKQPKASMKKEKGPVAPRGVSKRKAAVLDSDDDDTDSGDDINGGAGAGSSRKKKVSTGRQGARKKSRIVASDDDSDDDGESAEETERSAEATVSLQVLEPLLEEALDYLRGIDYEKSFEMELNDAILPGYSKKVKHPMDFTKIERKLMAHKYRSLEQFDSDVKLMVRNCRAYHGAEDEYTKVGNKLQKSWNLRKEDYEERIGIATGEATAAAAASSNRPARAAATSSATGAAAPPKKRIVINTGSVRTGAPASGRVVSQAEQAATLAKLKAQVPPLSLSSAAEKIFKGLEEIHRANNLPTEELVNHVLDLAWTFLRTVDTSDKFVKPVSDRDAPGYSSVVATKMDLTTMKRRLGRHDYASIDDFDEDARLISSNCLLYNWASLPFITASTHFQQAWERFRDRAVELYPAITTARMRSTRLEIPTMDRGTYISDEPSGDEQVIQLPYILTPSELHQATATARGAAGEVLSGPGLRAIMNAVLDYMMMLDDLGQFASPVLLPDYLATITNPMDFGTMRLKVERKKYKSIEEFEKDLMLVFQNCFQYNSLKDEITMYVEQMQFGWYLIRQNIQSVLQGDPSLAVQLEHPHIEGTEAVMVQRSAMPQPPPKPVPVVEAASSSALPAEEAQAAEPPLPPAAVATAHPVILTATVTTTATTAGRYRVDNSLIKLPHILTRKKLTMRLAAMDLKAASTLRSIMMLVWGNFTALDTQGYFAGPDNSAGYLEKVAEPIDLGIIKLKVERKKYKSIADFEADLDLLFSNCFSFYDRSLPQHMSAERLQFAWQLVKQNVQSVLAGDASLAVELRAEHTEGQRSPHASEPETSQEDHAMQLPAEGHGDQGDQVNNGDIAVPPSTVEAAATNSSISDAVATLPTAVDAAVEEGEVVKESKVVDEEAGQGDEVVATMDVVVEDEDAVGAEEVHAEKSVQQGEAFLQTSDNFPVQEEAISSASADPGATAEVADQSPTPGTADKASVPSGAGQATPYVDSGSSKGKVEVLPVVDPAADEPDEGSQMAVVEDSTVPVAFEADSEETATAVYEEKEEVEEKGSSPPPVAVAVAGSDLAAKTTNTMESPSTSAMDVVVESVQDQTAVETVAHTVADVAAQPGSSSVSEPTPEEASNEAGTACTPAQAPAPAFPPAGPSKPVPTNMLRSLRAAKHRLQHPLKLVCGKLASSSEGASIGDVLVLQDLPFVLADHHVSWALTLLRDVALQQLLRKQLAMRLRDLIVVSSDTSAAAAVTSGAGAKSTDESSLPSSSFARRVSFPHADALCRHLFQLCQMSLTYENRIQQLDDHVLRIYLPLLVYYTVRPDETIPVPPAGDSKAAFLTAKQVVRKVLGHADPQVVMCSRTENLRTCFSDRVVLREFLESVGTHLVNMKFKG